MASESEADIAPSRPRSKTDLFLCFTLLALQGFGGVLAVVQRELVDRKRWVAREQFVEDLAVAQIMPGPNVVNLSLMIGGRYLGLPGALAAVSGMLSVPTVLTLLLAALYSGVGDTAVAQGALRGMGAAAAGLITATGLKLFGGLGRNAMGLPACLALAALALVAIVLLHWPLLWVLLGIGGSASVWAYVKLGPRAGAKAATLTEGQA